MTKERSRLEALLQWIKGPDVLDLGCSMTIFDPESPNWTRRHIRKRFPNVWGLDINQEN